MTGRRRDLRPATPALVAKWPQDPLREAGRHLRGECGRLPRQAPDAALDRGDPYLGECSPMPPEGTREVLSDVNVEMRFARVVGVGLGLFVLTVLGGTAASSSPSLPLLPPPSFQPALDEWLTVTTGPTRHRFTVNPPRAIGIAPQVWAITIRRSDLSALQPYSLGTGLRRLRRSAVLIWRAPSGAAVRRETSDPRAGRSGCEGSTSIAGGRPSQPQTSSSE
jgi:hypothetical protein